MVFPCFPELYTFMASSRILSAKPDDTIGYHWNHWYMVRPSEVHWLLLIDMTIFSTQLSHGLEFGEGCFCWNPHLS